MKMFGKTYGYTIRDQYGHIFGGAGTRSLADQVLRDIEEKWGGPNPFAPADRRVFHIEEERDGNGDIDGLRGL